MCDFLPFLCDFLPFLGSVWDITSGSTRVHSKCDVPEPGFRDVMCQSHGSGVCTGEGKGVNNGEGCGVGA